MAYRCEWWPFPSFFALQKGSCFTYFSRSYFLTHCGVPPRQLMSLKPFFPMRCTTLYSIFSIDEVSCVFSAKSMLYILHMSSYFIDCCFEFSGIDSKEWYFKSEGCYINIFCSSSITITLHTGHSDFLLSLFLNKTTSKCNDLKSAINYFPNDSAL